MCDSIDLPLLPYCTTLGGRCGHIFSFRAANVDSKRTVRALFALVMFYSVSPYAVCSSGIELYKIYHFLHHSFLFSCFIDLKK